MENIMPSTSIGLDYKNDNVDTNERIIQLEKELQYTKKCLQTSILEGENSREELTEYILSFLIYIL